MLIISQAINHQRPSNSTNDIDTVDILGVNVSCVRRDSFLQIPLRWINGPNKFTVMYVNAHCLNLAVNDELYQATLNSADLVYADGVSVVWAAQILDGCALEKITGRDWIYDFCALAEKNAVRLYILAGKPGIAKTAQKNLEKQYPDLQIVGAHSGYLDHMSTPGVLTEINQAKPDIVLVGMGTPRQEKWLANHRHQIDVPVCWVVGALFDYAAGIEAPVPEWLNRLNLEWLWRLSVNPKGKWRRYLIGNPIFLFRIFRQKFR